MSLFMRRGKSFTAFCPTLPASVANVTSGTDLSKAIAGLSGWEKQVNNINQSVQAYRDDVQIPGPSQQQDASVTLLDDDGVSDSDSTARAAAAAALTEGTVGYIVLSPKKAWPPITGTKVQVWPVLVNAVNPNWSLDAAAATTTVAFSISGAKTDVTLT